MSRGICTSRKRGRAAERAVSAWLGRACMTRLAALLLLSLAWVSGGLAQVVHPTPPEFAQPELRGFELDPTLAPRASAGDPGRILPSRVSEPPGLPSLHLSPPPDTPPSGGAGVGEKSGPLRTLGDCVDPVREGPELGPWRFRLGDDPAWAHFHYDDSSWSPILVPGPWEPQIDREYDGFAWYRVRFVWGDALPCRPLGIRLGIADDIDETYLNGVLIGRTGRMPPRAQGAPSVVRVYGLPRVLLRPGENVLAVRVLDTGGPGGITGPRALVGDLQTLSSHLSLDDILGMMAPLLCAVVGLYFLLLYMLSPERRAGLYFFGFALGMSWLTLARSQLPGLMDLDPGMVRVLDWMGTYLSPPLLVAFIHVHYELEVPGWMSVVVGIVTLETLLLFIPSATNLRNDIFFYAGQPAILAMISLIAWRLIGEWWAGNKEAGWLGLGFLSLGVTASLEIVASLMGVNIPSLVPAGVAGFVLFVMGVLALREILLGRELAEQASALAAWNTRLERQVQERTHHLEAARATLQAQNERLAAFNALVSHDLKAPIRGLELLAGYFAADHSAALNEEGQRLLSLMRTATHQMSALVDGLTRLARQDQPPALETVPLDQVLEAVRGLLAADLLTRGARLEVAPGLPVVRGNLATLVEVFSNLVSNGLKYNRSPVPTVWVGLEPEARLRQPLGPHEVCIRVRDNGIGIASEHQQSIFEPFTRLHSSAEFEGTGIGLAIVRQAVENLQGRIELESTEGRGASFLVVLPTVTEVAAPV